MKKPTMPKQPYVRVVNGKRILMRPGSRRIERVITTS